MHNCTACASFFHSAAFLDDDGNGENSDSVERPPRPESTPVEIAESKELLYLKSLLKSDGDTRAVRLIKLHIAWAWAIKHNNLQGFPWKDTYKEEFQYLSHIMTSAGKKISKELRGEPDKGLDAAHFPFPAKRTIDAFYNSCTGTPTVEMINQLSFALANEMTKDISDVSISANFGIATDAMDIIAGIEKYGNSLFGLEADHSIDQLFTKELEQLVAEVATHTSQLFLVAPDGSVVLPLAVFPHTKLTSKALADMVLEAKQKLEHVNISWVALDGDLPDIGKYLLDMCVFRDTDHVAKSGRNALMNSGVHWGDASSGVKLTLLNRLLVVPGLVADDMRKRITSLMKNFSPTPSTYQKLSVKPIKRIVDPTLISYLDEIASGHALENQILSLTRFLKLMNSVLYLWEPNGKREETLLKTV
eukprot:CAMPEP_0206209312 /NCGR_PEP_ID=MMETSP0166-20121206/16839_1 /ASSEMBLY_ACC=CAM_ASM_000260 /TAXON_ID=95228 /ORGANISM="Vannella robusta, Strain DIVA3 518/3/11/1/6" /LENGTH=418 /DNA_ID=CAMNT_0053630695 /DNA_START=124 /DNA_END=1376 /DNA_ORIENTATION=+